MKIIITIGLLSSFFLVSCGTLKNVFTPRHKTNTIDLVSIDEQTKIGYETEKVIIYFGKKDVIAKTEKLLSANEIDPRKNRETLNELRSNLDTLRLIDEKIVVKDWRRNHNETNLHEYSLAGFLDQWILHDLIISGNAEIWNKKEQRYENKIDYHFVRGKLGGEQCFYTFTNGIEFHRQIIALGE